MNYQRIHDEIVEAARKRGWTKKTAPDYVEKHHIILKSLGGSDDADNLIYVTAREHFILHKLLYLINPCVEHAYSYVSFARMRSPHHTARACLHISSREIETARKISAELSSIRMKTNNPSTGKRGTQNHNNYCLWVTPFGTFESLYLAAEATGVAKTTLYGRCMQPDKIIKAPRLGRAMIGKTWREIGYDYILHEKEKE